MVNNVDLTSSLGSCRPELDADDVLNRSLAQCSRNDPLNFSKLGTIDQGFVNINNPFNSQLSSTSRAKTVEENHKYITTNHKFYRKFSQISIFVRMSY
ncbi:hypothetical protein MTR_3g005505 [Medicago truncatula]|uniref:Uncharacterized protein n=1 Tax=Medicago truncatula TaxID=3880 RepID=A0A072UT19_MEDTR|nr:hypothetical protein MTR_3g005505 [Medicago truncatula]